MTWANPSSAMAADVNVATIGGNPISTQGATGVQDVTLSMNANRLAAVSGLGDAQSGIGTPAVGPFVFNGTNYDHHRAFGAAGDGLGVALAAQPSSTPGAASANNAQAQLVFGAVTSQSHRLTYLDFSYAGGIPAGITLATITDGTTTYTIPQAASNAGQNETTLPPGGVKFASGAALTITLPASGTASTIGYINAAKVTA